MLSRYAWTKCARSRTVSIRAVRIRTEHLEETRLERHQSNQLVSLFRIDSTIKLGIVVANSNDVSDYDKKRQGKSYKGGVPAICDGSVWGSGCIGPRILDMRWKRMAEWIYRSTYS
jgi:hypothetical protein